MADFNIKDIQRLKFKIQTIERVSMVGLILLIAGFYYDWHGGIVWSVFSFLIVLYSFNVYYKKQLKQKEYLAKVVEERTIELRVQRDQVLQESEKLSKALDALAEAQDELVRSERLATVGQLTKGLLDRILNPINYINNFASLSVELIHDLEKNLKSKDASLSPEIYNDTIEILGMITGNLQKITEHGANTVRIVKAMEELLKDRKGKMASADINNLCKVNLDVIGKLFAREIEEKQIRLSFEGLALSLMIDINIEQMSKVLLNIFKNSMYALLKKAEKQAFEPELSVRLEKKGGLVVIRVYDNGLGIEDNIKEKIFEPFFTTKPTAEASGTGLYMSREIIFNHKGTITVSSAKNDFTEMTITVPIHQNMENNG